jgi:hypothetical protein
MISLVLFKPLVDDLFVTMKAFRLVVWPLIGLQPEPTHALEYCRDVFLRRTLFVGIFDTENEIATMVTGVEPAEQRGPDTAEVQDACWTWRKSGTYFHQRLLVGNCGASLADRSGLKKIYCGLSAREYATVVN